MKKLCPQCGRQMTKRYEDRVLLTDPPQYPWYWWCRCGHVEVGGMDRERRGDEEVYFTWDAGG